MLYFVISFGVALLLLLMWLRPSSRIRNASILGGILLLLVNIGWLIYLAANRPNLYIFVAAFFEMVIITVYGASLAILSRGRRRLFGIAIAILYPLGLHGGWAVGQRLSTENIPDDTGRQIAQALIAFRADHGEYPFVLDELVPAYLPGIVQPGTLWGWLYLRQADDFSLAYAWRIDREGYYLQTITSALTWEMQLPFTTPFDLPPTPFSRYMSDETIRGEG